MTLVFGMPNEKAYDRRTVLDSLVEALKDNNPGQMLNAYFGVSATSSKEPEFTEYMAKHPDATDKYGLAIQKMLYNNILKVLLCIGAEKQSEELFQERKRPNNFSSPLKI
mgnify:CR=1 FL=1